VVVALINPSVKNRLLREAALLLGLVFAGLVLLPIAIYVVGNQVFGDYGEQGFGGFFRELGGKIRGGDAVAWFLVLSPYLVWQILRLTALGWRLAEHATDGGQPRPPGLAKM
jgi:hypothetical protein